MNLYNIVLITVNGRHNKHLSVVAPTEAIAVEAALDDNKGYRLGAIAIAS